MRALLALVGAVFANCLALAADALEAALPSSLDVGLYDCTMPPNKALHPTAFGGG